ncbi:hypothetical protein B0I35DRAFT_176148 [Stachybotrys elegans]|uniref:Uncharacterized protein n=1 Tax=Stachybotrys elegans TaxID=80388 RepID=A0A8K0T2X3_9HYPO|nr:hypothetical protein B0I35DRAFT_176148 [Stachybotrys elegans]
MTRAASSSGNPAHLPTYTRTHIPIFRSQTSPGIFLTSHLSRTSFSSLFHPQRPHAPSLDVIPALDVTHCPFHNRYLTPDPFSQSLHYQTAPPLPACLPPRSTLGWPSAVLTPLHYPRATPLLFEPPCLVSPSLAILVSFIVLHLFYFLGLLSSDLPSTADNGDTYRPRGPDHLVDVQEALDVRPAGGHTLRVADPIAETIIVVVSARP